ncbi:hypothetical protein I7I50_06649 [Histoplasma capsulatum G186AR]|uniref:Uncharacterized protein n=1 Tax=Ajellomyces capsulatus TaxID=5037 RepID=A0A8H8D4V0_AJECA|nr:hypothetical protein I7I52_10277 [Histoplasma capsulatum]QSS67535.1 hypothetical protein I7I50_06649 [Histoplasma capsulatum G186AR]
MTRNTRIGYTLKPPCRTGNDVCDLYLEVNSSRRNQISPTLYNVYTQCIVHIPSRCARAREVLIASYCRENGYSRSSSVFLDPPYHSPLLLLFLPQLLVWPYTRMRMLLWNSYGPTCLFSAGQSGRGYFGQNLEVMEN